MDRIEGANAPLVTSTVEKYAKTSANATKYTQPSSDGSPRQTAQPTTLTGETMHRRIQDLVNSHPVMLFMKGTPQQPRCGFSRQLVDLLNSLETPYGTFRCIDVNEICTISLKICRK